jgi:ATP-dependent Clp protease ATP-binding subunit ClpA
MDMRRLDRDSRSVIHVAHVTAARMKATSIGEHHLLFGVAHVAPSLFSDGALESVMAFVGSGGQRADNAPATHVSNLPFSNAARASFARAAASADTLARRDIQPAHLLLALCESDDADLLAVLQAVGVSREHLIDALTSRDVQNDSGQTSSVSLVRPPRSDG